MRATRRHVTTAQRTRKNGKIGLSWTPQTPGTLRGYWSRSGKRNGLDESLANGEDLSRWLDTTGTYTVDTISGTAPTGVTAGSAVVCNPNAAGLIYKGFTVPADTNGTVGVLARTPGDAAAGRDYDCLLSFARASVSTIWQHICIKRISTTLRIGHASQNGAAFSSWHGNTTLSTGTWYRLIWVFSGGNSLAMYVNGVSQTVTNDTAGAVTTGQWLATTSTVDRIALMGRRTSGGDSEQWGGYLDETMWFSDAFSAGSVASLDAFLAAKSTGLT